MMPGSRRSLLQVMILLELKARPASSVAELSSQMGKLRPSVSRSLKLLKADGLVVREKGTWRVTEAGSAEASDATRQFESMWSDIRAMLQTIDGPMREVSKMAALVTQSPGMQETLRSIANAHSVLQAPGTLSMLNTIAGRQAADLQRIVNFGGPGQLPCAVTAMGTSQLNAIGRAMAPMLELQQQNASFLAGLTQSIAAPGIEALLRDVNLSVSSAIEDAFAMRATDMSTWPRWAASFPPLTVHFPKITESLGMFTSHELQRLLTVPGHVKDAWLISPPPVATAGYTRALRLAVDPEPVDGDAYPMETMGNPELASHLREIGEEYFVKYQGMWAALRSMHPDYMRHVAVSGRELLRAVLQHFVPDLDLDEGERGALLKPRIRRLLGGSDSGADWVFHFSQGALGFYQRLNAYTHADPGDKQSLRAMVMAVDGMLLFFVVHARRQHG